MVDHSGCGCGWMPPEAEKAGVSNVAWMKTSAAFTPLDANVTWTVVIFASGSRAIGVDEIAAELRTVVCAHGVLMVASPVVYHRPDEIHQDGARRAGCAGTGLDLLISRREGAALDAAAADARARRLT